MPSRRRTPFYSMGFAGSAGALDIICEAGEASGSGVWRRLTRGRALACVGRCRRANVGPGGGGAPDADEPQGRHATIWPSPEIVLIWVPKAKS